MGAKSSKAQDNSVPITRISSTPLARKPSVNKNLLSCFPESRTPSASASAVAPDLVPANNERAALSERKPPPVVSANKAPPVVLANNGHTALPEHKAPPVVTSNNGHAALPERKTPPVVPANNNGHAALPQQAPPVVAANNGHMALPERKTPSVVAANNNGHAVLPKNRAPIPLGATSPHVYANNGHAALPERRLVPLGAVPLPPKAATPNQVIVFHSSASWRAYFEASKASNKLIVIEFMATWCGPCRYMEPTLNEFATKYTNVEIVKIDVDELYNVSREYGVQAKPTFLLMKKGKVVDRVDGANKISSTSIKDELQRKIEIHRVV